MLRCLIPTILFAAQFLFSVYPVSAQSQSPSPSPSLSSSSCPCTLQGSVLDSVSGQPVPHAIVRLTTPSFRAALTDSEGKFQFENLPGGSVTLVAEKPGYVSQQSMGAHFSLPVSVQLAPDSPPAILKLIPESVIFGQVTDERGEPLEGFSVAIWSHMFDTGQGEVGLVSTFSAHTDDEGKFRIAKLSSGSYVLSVVPPQGAAQKSPGQSSIPSGYAPFIYSGANDLDSATPVKVLPGKSQQVNFSLKREPFVRLSGTVSGYNPGDQVTLNLRAAAGVQDPHIVFDPANGSFHTDWTAPGPYTLLAQATSTAAPEPSVVSSSSTPVLERVQVQESSPHSYASQQINAVSSVSDLRLVLQPTVDIPLIVHGIPANASVRLGFFPQFVLIPKFRGASNFEYSSDLENPEDVHPGGDLRMRFSGLPLGTYELLIRGLSYHSFYVESASSGTVNLLRENLVLSGSIPPIDVVLRDDPATLSGTVSSGHAPVSALSAEVVLVSNSRSKPILFSVSPNGAYKISGIPPGSYRVFATHPAVNPDYLDPAFQQRISSKIQEITLSSKQSASLNLELATGEE